MPATKPIRLIIPALPRADRSPTVMSVYLICRRVAPSKATSFAPRRRLRLSALGHSRQFDSLPNITDRPQLADMNGMGRRVSKVLEGHVAPTHLTAGNCGVAILRRRACGCQESVLRTEECLRPEADGGNRARIAPPRSARDCPLLRGATAESRIGVDDLARYSTPRSDNRHLFAGPLQGAV